MKRGTPDHPKVALLMSALSVPRYVAVGLLELLWHFTARYSPRGDIGRWSDERIAAALTWEGDPGALVAALVAAGWLDECRVNRFVVHDWKDHADDAAKKFITRNKLTFVVPERRKSRRVATSPDKSRLVAPAVAGAVAGAGAVVTAKPKPEPAPVATPDNVRRPSPDTAEPTNGNGQGVPEDQRQAYADQVWAEFLRKSEQPTNRSMTPGEFAVLKGWMDAGVPLRIVLRAIADTRGKGRMLAYFAPSVNQAIESWRSAVQPPAVEPAEETR